ncbi:polysaccharide biosynthesis tyrosine autokinase [Myxosarcina sp. GI1]|uniref:GumC family protein n=1 Tax=Myxosarcina sp. GI1 TaxID=1541065 RepID=UPI0006913C90|nr:polysaccharide biosynthesis tyrosine autokinase [Myxosarcina sp. GI1]
MTNIQTDKLAYERANNTERREAIDVNVESYLRKLRRRWLPALGVFLLTIGATAFLSTLLKETYKSEGKILFKQNSIDNLTGLGGETQQLNSLLNNQTPLSTEKLRLVSEPVLQQTIDSLKLEDKEGKPLDIKALKDSLDVEIVGGTDVISISYEHPDPYRAAKVVNTLMDTYIQEQIRSNQADTVNADSFINNQIPKVETKLKNIESNLQQFYEKNQVIDLQEEKRNLVNDLGTLNRQISTTGAELQGTQAQASSLQSQLGLNLKQAIAANQLGSTPTVRSILEQLTTTESQLAQERQRFNDNHPSVQSLLEKKGYLNQQLQQLVTKYVGTKVSEGLLESDRLKENQLEKFINLKIEELSLQTQLSALYNYQKAYLDRAKQLPKLEKTEQELLREVESARKTYETLLGNQQELQLLVNQQTGNAEVIELARVPEEGSTGRMALMIMGVLIGLLLSNLTAVLLEMQDRTLKTIPEIKQKFAYKVLGIIPLDSLKTDLGGIIVREEPDSFTSEIYRMIQANLKFLDLKRQPKVILLTSSVPGEGKSTIAANLAAAMAQLGRRVLVVDGDLRKSSQHQLWQVDNKLGVKDAIAHKTALEELVSRPMKQLDLLTSGVTAPNPLALLDSAEMSELVARARKEYDTIIIDAPPLPVTADVLTLSKLADGILFVTRPGVVEHESAELAQETLNNANIGQKVLGMVINGVKASEFDRYSYHAKYSKNYFDKSTSKSKSSSKIATA